MEKFDTRVPHNLISSAPLYTVYRYRDLHCERRTGLFPVIVIELLRKIGRTWEKGRTVAVRDKMEKK